MKEAGLLVAFEELQEAQTQVLRENDQLRQENAQMREVVEELLERIKQLEARAAKDSHNSSKPPSSNGFQEPGRKTKSLRGKSGKKSGGQPGHAGQTLLIVEVPDHTIVVNPSRCHRRQHDLAHAATRPLERFH